MSTTTRIKENINRILSAEMERADFLKLCGVATLGAIGISGVLKALTGAAPKSHQAAPATRAGIYGGKHFGG